MRCTRELSFPPEAVFALFFLAFVQLIAVASVLDEFGRLETHNATFIGGFNVTFSEISIEKEQILVDGRNISAFSNSTKPNITIVELFTDSRFTVDVAADSSSWVSVSVNTSTSGSPVSVTSNGSSLTQNTDWFYYSGNTTAKVNITQAWPRRITISFSPPSTTTTAASGGSGGGGGSGGSSAPLEAKQAIIIAVVTENVPSRVIFTNSLLDVKEIEFSPEKSVQNARVEARQTSSKPESASELSKTDKEDYRAYAYIEVTHPNMADSDIGKAKIAFEVNKSWLSDRGYAKEQVYLQRFSNGRWLKLPTTLASETPVKYRFESESPGLSVFVISIAIPVSAPSVSNQTSAAPRVISEETTTTTTEGEKKEGGFPATAIFVAAALVAVAYFYRGRIFRKANTQ